MRDDHWRELSTASGLGNLVLVVLGVAKWLLAGSESSADSDG